jgi:hypothetical protein
MTQPRIPVVPMRVIGADFGVGPDGVSATYVDDRIGALQTQIDGKQDSGNYLDESAVQSRIDAAVGDVQQQVESIKSFLAPYMEDSAMKMYWRCHPILWLIYRLDKFLCWAVRPVRFLYDGDREAQRDKVPADSRK